MSSTSFLKENRTMQELAGESRAEISSRCTEGNRGEPGSHHHPATEENRGSDGAAQRAGVTEFFNRLLRCDQVPARGRVGP